MDPFTLMRAEVVAALKSLVRAGTLPEQVDLSAVAVEPPRDPGHGCMATNAALVLAKAAGRPPRELATLLVSELAGSEDVVALEIAGPGFINLRLSDKFWQRIVPAVLNAGDDYGRLDTGCGERVLVEYVSGNPTGRLHVGHARGAVLGDVVANLLEFAGHEPVREYYINDAGTQVDLFARSVWLRYRELLGEEVGEIPPGFYPGPEPRDVAAALAEEHGDALLHRSDVDALSQIRHQAVDIMMAGIREDLARLGIRHDSFVSERRDVLKPGRLEALVDDLTKRDLAYQGRLPPPKGKGSTVDQPETLLLFRLSRFPAQGEMQDQAILRPDGRPTYFAADMLYHADKARRGFRKLINVWGAEHAGHIPRMHGAVEALVGRVGILRILVCQTVRFLRDGHVQTMSKRLGTTVPLRDLIAEVGADPVRFFMVRRSNTAQLDFDLARVVEQNRSNPVFYVQYAHARICSVMRLAVERFGANPLRTEALCQIPYDGLVHPMELALLRVIGQFPRVVYQAVRDLEPHRLAFYLSEQLAPAFHALWNQGTTETSLRFLQADRQALSLARVGMLAATQQVLASGLRLLGVSSPDHMA